jgi:hypothetical protein
MTFRCDREPGSLLRVLLLVLVLGVLSVAVAWGAEEEDEQEPLPPVSLQQLASAASLVAVAQVRDTDYVYARGFPTGGRAFLAPLISYKLSRPQEDIVEVYEEGLHAHECYFKNPTVFEEGRRHLVFFRDNPEVQGQYLGLPQGCALQVLVTADNRYALLYPPRGITLSDDLSSLAQALEFKDPYATITDDELSVAERDALLAAGMLEKRQDGRFSYTHGIPVSDIRPLLGAENITLQRELKR